MEMDEFLSLVNNSIRRRIIELLSREDHYPLQLSQILSVSPQVVMKHLKILQDAGVITDRREPSDKGGASRKKYTLNMEFVFEIGVGPNFFIEGFERLENQNVDSQYLKMLSDNLKALKEMPPSKEKISLMIDYIEEVNKSIKELEKIKMNVYRIKMEMQEEINRSVFRCIEDYINREVFYYIISHDRPGVREISQKMNVSEDMVLSSLRKLAKEGLLPSKMATYL